MIAKQMPQDEKLNLRPYESKLSQSRSRTKTIEPNPWVQIDVNPWGRKIEPENLQEQTPQSRSRTNTIEPNPWVWIDSSGLPGNCMPCFVHGVKLRKQKPNLDREKHGFFKVIFQFPSTHENGKINSKVSDFAIFFCSNNKYIPKLSLVVLRIVFFLILSNKIPFVE